MEKLPDIKELTLTLWRRKWIFLAVMLVPVVAGFFVISSMPEQYTASAAVLIEKQELKLANFEDALAGSKFDEQTVQTQIGVIKSQTLALKTIKEANLLHEPEFSAALEANAQADDQTQLQAIMKQFMNSLDVAPHGTSHVVHVSFTSHDPQLAARVANEHTQNYIDYGKSAMAARAESLEKWLTKQVEGLKAETQKKAEKVQQYRAEHGLVMGEGAEELIYQQISDLSALLIPLETRRLELEARQSTIDRVDSEGRRGALSQVISSPLIQNLKTQQALAEQKLQMLRANYGPRHPTLMAASNEVREISGKINAEIANIADSTTSELATVRHQEELLKAKMAQLQKDADSNRGDHVTLNALESDLLASRTALSTTMVRLEDVRAQGDLTRSNAEVIAWANVPAQPSKPNKPLLFLLVVVLAGGLGLAAVFVAEISRSGFHSLQEVKKVTGRTPLGIIPYEKSPNPNKLVSGYSIYSDAIKKIYMYGLMRKAKGPIGQTVLVASAQPNEGKSTLVMSLAYYMASIGKKVLVVDTDINRPSIHAMARIKMQKGFSDLVTENAKLLEVIHRDSANKIDIICAGSTRMLSPELWQSDHSQALIQLMKQHYDFVLFDSPPLLALSDASALASLMDEVLVVAEWSRTSQKKVAHIIEQIESFSKPVLGVVLTKVKVHQYATYNHGEAGIYYGANARYYANT